MILPQLLWRFLRHGDDTEFFRMQTADSIRWLRRHGVSLGEGVRALDLGCGHGVFGRELAALGCSVTYADTENLLMPELKASPFRQINLDTDDLGSLGRFDLAIFSNVLAHLASPEKFLGNAHQLLNPNGRLYLSWTNWLSPFGGHEISPWHYLGPTLGRRVHRRINWRLKFQYPKNYHTRTYIGAILRFIRERSQLEVEAAAPRYYTEFSFLVAIPGVREFATWNCALLLKRRDASA